MHTSRRPWSRSVFFRCQLPPASRLCVLAGPALNPDGQLVTVTPGTCLPQLRRAAPGRWVPISAGHACRKGQRHTRRTV
eukprot:scaffold3751_cov117-Isochrysis_galbana.AAC.4